MSETSHEPTLRVDAQAGTQLPADAELHALLSLPTLTVEQAGLVVGLSRASAYRAAERGEIPTLRFGRRIVVPTARLRALLGVAPATTD